MALLPILEFPDPRLRTRAKPVGSSMLRCSGWSPTCSKPCMPPRASAWPATQVNVHRALLVMDTSQEKNQPQVYINPQILEPGGVEVVRRGLPVGAEFLRAVERAARVRVRAQDARRQHVRARARAGSTAVCVQHEMDHLAGKLFVDYLSSLKRERIRRKLEKERRERAGSSPARGAGRRAPCSARSYDACCASPSPVRRSSRCRRCEALAGSSHRAGRRTDPA